jgi:cell division protein ZapA
MGGEGMKKRLEVEIYNQTFIVTSEDDEQYVREIASYVDERMRQIGGSTKTAVPLRVAIMAALSIADEYHKAIQRENETQHEIERLSSFLEGIAQSERSDGRLPTDTPLTAFSSAGTTIPSEGNAKKNAVPSS